MLKFFSFSRKATIKKLDENGNLIPLTVVVKKPKEGVEGEFDLVPETVPGKFETEEVIYEDIINLARVIRVHRTKKDQVVVLLDDGHEETRKEPALKNPNKKGPITKADITEEKIRSWVQSEILLEGEDVERLYGALKTL